MSKVPKTQTFSGGKVVRESEKKWTVFAPDGRNVGTYPTRHQAVDKAQHWDKWDALNSLSEILATIAPFTFVLMTNTLLALGKEKLLIPTKEQMTTAAIADYFLLLAKDHPEIIEKLKERPELLKEVVDKVLKSRSE